MQSVGWGDGSVYDHLLYKCEDLSVTLQHPCKKPALTLCAYHPNNGGRDKRILAADWLTSLAEMVNLWFGERPCLWPLHVCASDIYM